MLQISTRYHRLVGGLALLHTAYMVAALIFTQQAMLLFTFGSVGFAYRSFLISNHSSTKLVHWLRWSFWLTGVMALAHCLLVLWLNANPDQFALNGLAEDLSTVRLFDFAVFFTLFILNTFQEKRAQAFQA